MQEKQSSRKDRVREIMFEIKLKKELREEIACLHASPVPKKKPNTHAN